MLEHFDGLLTEFDEGLWNATIETATVRHDGNVVFRWRNGTETSIINQAEKPLYFGSVTLGRMLNMTLTAQTNR